MIGHSERVEILQWVDEAQAQGARRQVICQHIGLSIRTVQRWRRPDSEDVKSDGRSKRHWQPPHKLSAAERSEMLARANSAEFAALPPSQFVPILAERGEYIASESSFYRVLREVRQLKHRLKSRPPERRREAKTLCAQGPNEVYSWDITYLKTTLKGVYFYLYLMMDVYSRKIVGWCIEESESSERAAQLMHEVAEREGVNAKQLTLHSDNGSAMKGASLRATLETLGIASSFSRPRVSNDNPYSESLFKTLKYRADFPDLPFGTLETARRWVRDFVHWYNHEHRHSAIRFVTPEQRHSGEDKLILAQRDQTYAQAKIKAYHA